MMKSMDGWGQKNLTELAEYINGYAFKPEDWGENGLPIIRIEQLKKPNAPTDYFSGKLPAAQVIEDGDLIFSWSASLFLRIWQHGQAALNQHLFKVVEREGVDRAFLKSFIEFYLPELTKASHGSTMQHITRKELERFTALFPNSKDEQIKIAEILSTVDQAIEQTEALIAKQQRIKTGLMQDLLNRGIDNHGNLRSEHTHDFKDSPLGKIPVEWEVRSLGELVDEGITYGIVQAGPHIENGVPYIRTGDMAGDAINVDELLRTSQSIANSYKRATVYFGDIVFALRATVGKVLPVSKELEGANLTQGTAKISPKKTIDSTYLLWALQTAAVQYQISLHQKGTTFMEITLKDIRSLQVAVPVSQDEQKSISEKLEKHNCLRVQYLQQLENLRSIKIGLMQDLLTGKRPVTALLDETEVGDFESEQIIPAN
ncbi:restriction endonuclease subunit S [Paenibacillus aestuarii]|uniref:Restriction endonuclease subunit S n=1 Tax=Paenibacillus aestuarii TaxID=516965 RepID=A0ABW0KHJ7_9BACL